MVTHDPLRLVLIGAVTVLTGVCLLLWAGPQKFGAFALVGVGVLRDLFGPLALLVAFFDLATALLCRLTGRRLVSRAGAARTVGAGG
ncbi:hypothetical protein ACFT8P_20795 [Streptomyces sp. NPDC057101]|uniref:hypothetical protein n=1 Tax=Streptomyces sp. NPDC057101 TaxID=3346020 RepID=UPI003643A7D5